MVKAMSCLPRVEIMDLISWTNAGLLVDEVMVDDTGVGAGILWTLSPPTYLRKRLLRPRYRACYRANGLTTSCATDSAIAFPTSERR